MKRQLSLILAALLCLSMLAAMVACDKGNEPADTTAAETDAPTEQVTEAPTEETTEAPTEEPTTEEVTTDNTSAPVEGAINIGTAEDFCFSVFHAVILFRFSVHADPAGLQDLFYLTACSHTAVAKKLVQSFHGSSIIFLPPPP